jgi:hypothetical protein
VRVAHLGFEIDVEISRSGASSVSRGPPRKPGDLGALRAIATPEQADLRAEESGRLLRLPLRRARHRASQSSQKSPRPHGPTALGSARLDDVREVFGEAR